METTRNRGGRPPGRTYTRRLGIMFTPDEEQRAREAARRERISIAEFIRRAVREAAGRAMAEPADPWAGLPRRSPEELRALIEKQGVKPVQSIDELGGDFWPADEEEDPDAFIKQVRAWRNEDKE